MILPCTVSKISACKGKKMSLQWTNLADAIRTKLSRGTQNLKKGGYRILHIQKSNGQVKTQGKILHSYKISAQVHIEIYV